VRIFFKKLREAENLKQKLLKDLLNCTDIDEINTSQQELSNLADAYKGKYH